MLIHTLQLKDFLSTIFDESLHTLDLSFYYQYHLFFSFKISLVISSIVSSDFPLVYLCSLKILKKKNKNIRYIKYIKYIKYIIHAPKLLLKSAKSGIIHTIGMYIMAKIINIRLMIFNIIKPPTIMEKITIFFTYSSITI